MVSPSLFENSFTFKGTSDILSATFVYSHTESVGDISKKSSRLINSFPAERSKTPTDSQAILPVSESGSLVTIAPSSTVLKHYSMETDSSDTQSGSEIKRTVQYTSGSMVSPVTSQIPSTGEGLISVHSSVNPIDISTYSNAAKGQETLSPKDALNTNTLKFSELKTTGIKSTVPLTTSNAPTLSTKLALATTPQSTYTVHCDPHGPGEALTPNCTTPVTQETPVEGSFNDTHVLDEVCMAEIYAGQRWEQTPVGHTAVTQCLQNPYEIITRLCLSSRLWAEPDIEACSIPPIGQQLDDLFLQAVDALLLKENVEKWSHIAGAGEEVVKLIEAVDTFAARTSGNECHLSLNPTSSIKTFEGVYQNIVFLKMQFKTESYEGGIYSGGDAEIVVNSNFYTSNGMLNDTVTSVIAFYPTIASLVERIRTGSDQSVSQVYPTIVTASTIHQTTSDHNIQFTSPFCMSFTSVLQDQSTSWQCAFITRSTTVSPLLPIGVTLAFWIDDFGGANGHCWLHENAQISAIVATALVAMTNICLLIGLHPHLRRSRKTFPRGYLRTKPYRKGIRSEIQCNMLCLVVLTLCWTCGLLFLTRTTSSILRYIFSALAITQSLGFVVAHNFVCSPMKTALKHASRESWRQHIAASVPTSTSVSQIRPERDIGMKHHDDQTRREHGSKGEDAMSRVKSEVTTSASSAFRWRIEHWRRRTNVSNTDQSRRTMSTSIGTDSRRLGSSSTQQRDRRDTLSIPIEENDLDLELTRSLSKATSRSGHVGYHMGSVCGTERSSRTGNIVLEHMRLEPLKRVSLVGNETLREDQHRRSLDYRRSSRKMSSTDRPSLYDGTMDSWSQTGRYHGPNINTRKHSSFGVTSQRNTALNDSMCDPSSNHKRRYKKKSGRNTSRPPSLSSEQQAPRKDAARQETSREQYSASRNYEHQLCPCPEQESKELSMTYHQPRVDRHIDVSGGPSNITAPTIYGQLSHPYPGRDIQGSSKAYDLRGRGHLDPIRIKTTEQSGVSQREESMGPSYKGRERHMYDDLPGSENKPRGEVPAGSDERRARTRPRRKRKKKSHPSQGSGKT
ncbi:uncharacterized protein LOC105441149 [Strongylocentrotus purpuratus]|uniref:G-protein coupled receptors family 2 profile 1 domain-containing protein n=1 Tax=Strongylocentrotus purpuratus TaxID=7668 RepID=A0A7M7N9Y2_STRPU|nr:uncharacterized protein LOC105441149 [Strongylocentrotus purpuratus]